MKKKLLSAVMAIATATSSLAIAQPGRGDHNNGPDRRGCYSGERRDACSQRRRAEQRTHRRYVWNNGRYESQDRTGAAIAGGILGFILGTVIAGSSSDRDYYEAHKYDRAWRTRCRTAYGDFDYRSGTYVGPDGYRHYCTR